MPLTNKRRVFIEEYLRCWNATEAATIADYAHPGSQGHRLLNIVEITEEIDRRIDEKAMGADEVLNRLAEQARGDIDECLTVDHGIVMVDWEKLKAKGLTHLVKKFKQTKAGIEVEFYDAQSALVHLGRHHKLFTDKTEHSGQINVTELSDDELKRIAEG